MQPHRPTAVVAHWAAPRDGDGPWVLILPVLLVVPILLMSVAAGSARLADCSVNGGTSELKV
jgi:hypothetical protein